MKLLFLANRIPYPPYRGDKLKIFNLARRLSQRHELHLLTFAESQEDLQYKAELEKVFASVHLVYLPKWQAALNCFRFLTSPLPVQVLYFQSAQMKSKLEHLLTLHEFDAIHVQHLRMAPYLSANTSHRRILDLPDAFSLYWRRRRTVQKNPLTAFFERMEQKRLERYEAVLNFFDLSLVCSVEDIQYLSSLHGKGKLRLLPNGVDLETFSPPVSSYQNNQTLLFTGNMDYAPNVDAVIYFTREVLPLIRERFPEVQFVIAGQRPVEKVKQLEDTYVRVTGFVADLATVYREASVVVAPLRFGAGTQNKVLEAMAMGVPVVCSSIGFQGLGIQNGEGAFMCADKNSFVNTVCDLLSFEDLRRQTGQKGREVVLQNFDWNVIVDKLEQYFTELQDD